MRLLGNHADADDAVQDALVLAHRKFHQFRGQANIATWLTSIVLNSAKMQLRRRRPNHISLDHIIVDDGSVTLSDRLTDGRLTPDAQFAASQAEAQFNAALGKLSPILYQAFQLRYVEGLPIREVATLLDIPIGTVKARASRARRELTQLLRRMVA
jgi:RNA polymerase sigma-70 factor (ECF subfamily)